MSLVFGGFGNANATISGNTLTYVIQEGLFFEVDNNGTTTTVTEDITLVYTKQ